MKNVGCTSHEEFIDESNNNWTEAAEEFQQHAEYGAETDSNLLDKLEYLLKMFRALTIWFLASILKKQFNIKSNYNHFMERLRHIEKPILLDSLLQKVLRIKSVEEFKKYVQKNNSSMTFIVLLGRHFAQTLTQISSILTYHRYQYDMHQNLAEKINNLDDYCKEIRDNMFRDKGSNQKLMRDIDN